MALGEVILFFYQVLLLFNSFIKAFIHKRCNTRCTHNNFKEHYGSLKTKSLRFVLDETHQKMRDVFLDRAQIGTFFFFFGHNTTDVNLHRGRLSSALSICLCAWTYK